MDNWKIENWGRDSSKLTADKQGFVVYMFHCNSKRLQVKFYHSSIET